MRRFLTGEIALPVDLPPPGLEIYIIVYQIRPGYRARIPIGLPDDNTGGPGIPAWSEEQMLAMVPAIYR